MTLLLNKFLETFTYLALVAVLLAAGLGLPVPEDIPLLTSGYLCHPSNSLIDSNNDGIPDTEKRVPNVYLMIAAGMIGVLAGDSIVFFIGRRGIDSNNFVARHLRKVLHSNRRARAERHFARHGNLTVFAGRFMPGFRSIVFAMAGMAKMSYPRFLAIDGLAAAISVPTFVILGYKLAEHITLSEIPDRVAKVKHIVGPIALVIIAGAIAIYIVRRRRQKQLEALAGASAPAPAAPQSTASQP